MSNQSLSTQFVNLIYQHNLPALLEFIKNEGVTNNIRSMMVDKVIFLSDHVNSLYPFRTLLSMGINPDYRSDDYNLLYNASFKDSDFYVRALVEYGVNPNVCCTNENQIPLNIAADTCRWSLSETFLYLLKVTDKSLINNVGHSSSIDRTVLSSLATHPVTDLFIFEELVGMGADLEIKDKTGGYTALELAAIFGDDGKILDTLLPLYQSKGIEVDYERLKTLVKEDHISSLGKTSKEIIDSKLAVIESYELKVA